MEFSPQPENRETTGAAQAPPYGNHSLFPVPVNHSRGGQEAGNDGYWKKISQEEAP